MLQRATCLCSELPGADPEIQGLFEDALRALRLGGATLVRPMRWRRGLAAAGHCWQRKHSEAWQGEGSAGRHNAPRTSTQPARGGIDAPFAKLPTARVAAPVQVDHFTISGNRLGLDWDADRGGDGPAIGEQRCWPAAALVRLHAVCPWTPAGLQHIALPTCRCPGVKRNSLTSCLPVAQATGMWLGGGRICGPTSHPSEWASTLTWLPATPLQSTAPLRTSTGAVLFSLDAAYCGVKESRFGTPQVQSSPQSRAPVVAVSQCLSCHSPAGLASSIRRWRRSCCPPCAPPTTPR